MFPEGTIHTLVGEQGPSRLGVITPKSVGNAVARHAVARKVRHAWPSLLANHPSGLEVVVRAQTGATRLSLNDWVSKLEQAVAKASR